MHRAEALAAFLRQHLRHLRQGPYLGQETVDAGTFEQGVVQPSPIALPKTGFAAGRSRRQSALRQPGPNTDRLPGDPEAAGNLRLARSFVHEPAGLCSAPTQFHHIDLLSFWHSHARIQPMELLVSIH